MPVDKKVNLELVGIDGNAFSIMAAFRQQAKKEGWTEDEIKEVLDEAKSGDYCNLLSVIMDHCENNGFGTEDDEENEIDLEEEDEETD
ncbi:MAG TPA: hypothetical protein PLP33_29240 [Leptospiraceae bacterium]|nr:hypothetical protein [Leptospiraceae bacterium]